VTRVAYLSPLPPETSGIADYSAELLGALGARCDLEVYAGGGARRVAGLDVRPYGRFLDAHARRPCNAVLYHLGNSGAFHGEIYRLLQAAPGIVVLHEYMLHDMVRHAGEAVFDATRTYCYGRSGGAGGMRADDASILPWAFPLFERAVDASRQVIVHSEDARRRVLRSRPRARVTVVPHHLSLEALSAMDDAARHALRRRLRISDGAFVVASFGTINRAKRIEVSLRAFARLRRDHPEAVYLLAGAVSPEAAAIEEVLAGELGRGVIVTGRLPLPDLLGLMALADVAVNLRHPTGGETSGTCMRLLGLGTPMVVSAGGWFAEIPDGCCARIAPDALEEEELVAVLAALAGQPGLRRGMGAAAARWAGALTVERSADGYAAVIDKVVRGRQAPHVDPLPPLGVVAAAEGLVADVGVAAAALGVPDTDTVLLPQLAADLHMLGLGGGG
jgi:glycosyltransferase involved in cell wall biosynthesis